MDRAGTAPVPWRVSEFTKLIEEIAHPDSVLTWMNEVHLQDPRGSRATYGVNPLVAPVKTLVSALTQNRFLGPLDKLSAALFASPALDDFERSAETSTATR